MEPIDLMAVWLSLKILVKTPFVVLGVLVLLYWLSLPAELPLLCPIAERKPVFVKLLFRWDFIYTTGKR